MRKVVDYLVPMLILAGLGMTMSFDAPTGRSAFPLFLGPRSVHAFAAPSAEMMKQRETRLIEAAKKEGKLVYWSSTAAADMEQVLSKFRERYPFLKTDHWRSDAVSRQQKLLSEARAGIYNPDAVGTDIELILELKKAGLMKRYDWPSTREWPPSHKDPEGYWVARNDLPIVMAYNTSLVSAAEAPKSWEDVLDPKWKGSVSLGKDGVDWVMMLWAAWGKEKMIRYLKRVSQNSPIVGGGATTRTELLAAGAFKIDLRLNLNRVMEYKDKGAPIEWVRTNPILSKTAPIFIAERAPHPNAAMLFADWFTSTAGQKAFYDATGSMVLHLGIKSSTTTALKGLNVVSTSPEIAMLGNEAIQIFHDIFWK